MAQMAKLEIDLTSMVNEAMIDALVAVVDACPQYRFATVLALITNDDLLRVSLAEAMGEAAVAEHKADQERTRFANEDTYEGEKSWDEIFLQVLYELGNTQAGKGIKT